MAGVVDFINRTTSELEHLASAFISRKL